MAHLFVIMNFELADPVCKLEHSSELEGHHPCHRKTSWWLSNKKRAAKYVKSYWLSNVDHLIFDRSVYLVATENKDPIEGTEKEKERRCRWKRDFELLLPRRLLKSTRSERDEECGLQVERLQCNFGNSCQSNISRVFSNNK